MTSQSHRTLRHAQGTQVQFTLFLQVQKDLNLDIHNPAVAKITPTNIKPVSLPSCPGLCAPSHVNVSQTCQDSIVSWSDITGAEMFIATATADDGHTRSCSSNFSNSCYFTDLRCSETYAVTVVTVDRGCRSEPSGAVELKTGERKQEG